MIPCKRKIFFLLLLIMPMTFLPAQYDSRDPSSILPEIPQPEKRILPQWLKDLRRWEIITFGSFPFSMFFTTFGVDMIRWYNNRWDTRYAPWPIKSAGAIAMERREVEVTIAIAAGASIGAAIIDLIIVHVKRAQERRKAEAIPVGAAEIKTKPYPDEAPEKEVEEIPTEIMEMPLDETPNVNLP